VLGGAIALIGTQLTKRDERLTLQLKLSQELKIAEFEAREAENEFKRTQLQHELEVKKIETEAEIAAEIQAGQAFKQSLKGQLLSSGNWLVDSIRGLMRPVITSYMLIIMSYIAYNISVMAGGFDALPLGVILDLYQDIINQIMFLTVTCVTWWFGSRPSSQRRG
jgi:hypothetical protein